MSPEQTAPNGADEILTEQHDGVLTVTFNRPHALNAMTNAMEDRLIAIFDAVNTDDSVKALVLTGAPGSRPSFMAGQDFSCLQGVEGRDGFLKLEQRGEEVIAALEAVRLPTLAAIAGVCAGGGAILAAACDVRIASASARVGCPIAKTAGNCLSYKCYTRLADMLGIARAKELIFNPRLINAESLLACGAIREFVQDDAQLMPRAQEIATELAALAPLTLFATKRAFLLMRDQAIPKTGEEDMFASCYLSEDFREGVSAFLEKRKPAWRGC